MLCNSELYEKNKMGIEKLNGGRIFLYHSLMSSKIDNEVLTAESEIQKEFYK